MKNSSESVSNLKSRVKAHWNQEVCGTRGVNEQSRLEYFKQIEVQRYSQESFIKEFAQFENYKGKRVLEIGLGAGTDFMNWVRAGADVTGIDLTESSVSLVEERLKLENLKAKLVLGDAENLPFPSEHFELVYSYGVLHHSPDTVKAIEEVFRVLMPGGEAKIMVYHVPSWTGWMLWLIHCFAKVRPWVSPKKAIYDHLESFGTKAYTMKEAKTLFHKFEIQNIYTRLGSGDLLLMERSQKYQSGLYALIWKFYPRLLVRLCGDRFGLFLMAELKKAVI